MTRLYALKKQIDAGCIAELYVPLQPGTFSANDMLLYVYKQTIDNTYVMHIRLRGQWFGSSTVYPHWHMLFKVNEPLLQSAEWVVL